MKTKHWQTKTKKVPTNNKQDNESIVDVYKKEILDTRVTVSGIFSKRNFDIPKRGLIQIPDPQTIQD